MNTVINVIGAPSGLTLFADVRHPTTLAILETVSLTEASGVYSGTVVSAVSGLHLFVVRNATLVFDVVARTIEDTLGPFTIAHGLELLGGLTLDSGTLALLNQIKAKTDLIGAVTWIVEGASVSSTGSIVIKAGDRKVFTLTSDTEDAVPDLTGIPIRFGIRNTSGVQLLSKTSEITVLNGTGFQSVEIVLLPSETILIPSGGSFWDVQAEYSPTDVRTFFTGSATTRMDYSGV